MNRGQNYGTGGSARIWVLACILLAAAVGISSAATTRAAKPQPDRSWESYYGVTILPSGRAIVVGDKGVVMTSDDQGRTWTRQELMKGPKYYDLYSAAFTSDGKRGWLVGDDAVIFRSDDQGTTWTAQQAPNGTTAALLKIGVADEQKACAVGEHGVLLCTVDGGSTWNLQKFQDFAFFDVHFTDPNNVWAVGEFATLLHSTDGGKSWKAQSGGENGKGDPLFSLAFEGQKGIAVGLIGSSLQTNDGGKTWQAHELPIEHRSLYTIAPVPTQTDEFYAAGESGLSALLMDGEVTQVPSGVADSIAAVAFSPRFAMAVGLSGTLLQSADGGRHWRSLVNKPLLTQAQ